MDTYRITTLVENTAAGTLAGEHGLSFLIKTPEGAVLFDTGQGHAISANVGALGVDLSRVTAIALSHGHYDHTGGLAWALDNCRGVDVYVHPAALEPKFACEPGSAPRDIGIQMEPEAMRTHLNLRRLVFTEAPAEIAPGLFLTGEVPRVTDFEDTGGPFYRDGECREPDVLPDDQALYFEGSDGLVVVLGCAHAGVVNTLRRALQLAGKTRIHAVLGGMHLVRADRRRMQATLEAFEKMQVERIGACHCTGLPATVELWKRFPDRSFECRTGTVMEFQAAATQMPPTAGETRR